MQLQWLVNLASFVCNVSRVSALYFVVVGSISCWGDHGIHCWWDLIKAKQLSSVSVCCAQVFTVFSGRGNCINNTIPQFKKEKCKTGFLPSCEWVSTTVNMYDQAAKEAHGKKVRCVLHKNVKCYFEQILKASHNKTVTVRPLTSHHTNVRVKVNKPCR